LSLQQQIYELFLLDSQLRGLSSSLNSATRRRDAQQNKLDRLRIQHSEMTEQLRHCQAAANAAEKQVDEIDRKIDHHREQMNSVTSNKQYSALLVEVSTLKHDKAKLEEQALAEMNGVDQSKERLAELDAESAEQEKLFARASDEGEAARAEVGDRLDELQAERDKAAAQIPADVLSLFDRLSDAYDGEAVAEIEEQDRRRMEYICGGCYMSLPVEIVNRLMTRQDEMVNCTNCNRILYVKDSLKQALAPK